MEYTDGRIRAEQLAGEGADREWDIYCKEQFLGRITWDKNWRAWVYEPDMDTIYSFDCLESIANIIKKVIKG